MKYPDTEPAQFKQDKAVSSVLQKALEEIAGQTNPGEWDHGVAVKALREARRIASVNCLCCEDKQEVDEHSRKLILWGECIANRLPSEVRASQINWNTIIEARAFLNKRTLGKKRHQLNPLS